MQRRYVFYIIINLNLNSLLSILCFYCKSVKIMETDVLSQSIYLHDVNVHDYHNNSKNVVSSLKAKIPPLLV